MKSNDYDEATIKKAGETAKSYVKNNYQDIETIEIKEVYESPMGGMMIDVLVNDKYEISLSMDEVDFTIKSSADGEGFPDLKKECEDTVCDY